MPPSTRLDNSTCPFLSLLPTDPFSSYQTKTIRFRIPPADWVVADFTASEMRQPSLVKTNLGGFVCKLSIVQYFIIQYMYFRKQLAYSIYLICIMFCTFFFFFFFRFLSSVHLHLRACWRSDHPFHILQPLPACLPFSDSDGQLSNFAKCPLSSPHVSGTQRKTSPLD